ncbi:MAG: DUF3971 domain-containing protein [Epsilonproteobacteria bacterium]|nr:hypothetical protein [Campylobacterota bacterium]NPA57452.1 DUF3971 domain-containing protein [Campylobacterota bacterium]
MIIRAISEIRKSIFEIILIIAVLFSLLYLLLLEGIFIERVGFGGLEIETLYLKLDKKLIVEVGRLTLPPPQEGEGGLPEWIGEGINLLPRLFQRVEIDQVKIGDAPPLGLHYKEGHFRLHSDELEADLSLFSLRNTIYLQLHTLSLPPYSLTLQGSGRLSGGELSFAGDYRFHGIGGSLSLRKGERVEFLLSSHPFRLSELRKVLQSLPLDREIVEWSSERVQAERYQISQLWGSFDLEDPLGSLQMEGKGEGRGVTITFHHDLPPVRARKVLVTYRNDTLSFALERPTYLDKDLEGSMVHISRVGREGSSLTLHLRFSTPFDDGVGTLLESYGVAIPLRQLEGVVEGNLSIEIPFDTLRPDLEGYFHTGESLLSLDGTLLEAEELTLHLLNGRLTLHPSPLHLPPWASARAKGYLDFERGVGKVELEGLRISLERGGRQIVELEEGRGRLTIDLERGELRLPLLNLTYRAPEKSIVVDHIEELIFYSPLLQRILPDYGRVVCNLERGETLLEIEKENRVLWRGGRPITHFAVKVDLERERAWVNDFATISFGKRPRITIKGVTIDLTPLLEGERGVRCGGEEYLVALDRVLLKYGNHSLPVPSGYLNAQGGKMTFVDRLHRGSLSLTLQEGLFHLTASSISATTLNALLGVSLFRGGSYTLNGDGEKGRFMGRLTIDHGYLSDLKVVNNLFAFLNTLPALVTLSNPGFDREGFLVKRGEIDYSLQGDYLFLPRIDLSSDAMSLHGNGFIDLERGELHLKIKVETFTKLTSLLKKIPVAGYILLGDDGQVTTTVEIRGPLEDPKIRSLLPKETVEFPFHLIERTLKLPFKLLGR